jgi:predicted DNA-binding transcriptional regulator YafY
MDFNDLDVLIELAATGGRASVDPEIFAEIFHAWKNCLAVNIHYHRVEDGAAMDLFAEPHHLKMHDGVWYIKVKLVSGESTPVIRTLALHRITEVYTSKRKFERNSYLPDTDDVSLFALPRHSEVKLSLRNSAIQYAQEYLPPGNFTMERNEMILTVYDIEDYKIYHFVLLSGENATILHPPELRRSVIEMAGKSIKANSNKTIIENWLKRIKYRIFGKLF